jgi:cytochrome P450
MRGTLPFDMLDLHKRYGDIVRIAPDELAFSHPDAWKEIMGHKKGEQEFSKAAWFYQPVEGLPRHIVNEEREEHGRLRRQMAHGFSEKSMRSQEPLIRGYVDFLLQRLREFSQDGSSVVISDWYNYTTFDIIGDLAFGEPFGCLEGSNYDTWIKSIFKSGQMGTILQSLSFFPSIKKALLSVVPKSMREAQEQHKRLTKAKMLRRMERTEERDDLIEGLLKKRDELVSIRKRIAVLHMLIMIQNLTAEKLIANAEILIIGGSETTASLLSGVTYLLLTNQDAYEKLKDEVRNAFQSQDEINLISVAQLPYLQACLEEGLRMYPPVANGLPRVCPPGGATILGNFIPENVS